MQVLALNENVVQTYMQVIIMQNWTHLMNKQTHF